MVAQRRRPKAGVLPPAGVLVVRAATDSAAACSASVWESTMSECAPQLDMTLLIGLTVGASSAPAITVASNRVTRASMPQTVSHDGKAAAF